MAARIVPIRAASQRSPARQQLADAIARRSELEGELKRIVAARAALPARYETSEKAAALRAKLEKARADEPRRYTAELLGEPVGPSSVTKLAAALAEADEQAQLINGTHVEFDAREKDARDRLEWLAEPAVERAVAAALAESPAISALFAQYDRAREALAEVMHCIQALPSESWPADQRLGLAFNYLRYQDRSAAAPWHAALEALRADPDAVLPDVLSSEPAPLPAA